jgi:hypothetical protein
MTELETQLDADLQAMVDHMPVEATFGGQTVDCSKTVRAITETGDAAGELTGYRFSLHSTLSAWETLPTEGDLITVAAVAYRVLRIVDDVVGIRFDMGAKYTEQTLK